MLKNMSATYNLWKNCQINRVKHCFDQNTLTYILCAVVMGKLYWSTVWSNTSTANIIGNLKLSKILFAESWLMRKKLSDYTNP